VSIPSYPDLFNDVFGPIMQPGSSSHTAAPCRIGFLAYSLLGEPPREIHVQLDANGSFAGTFGLMAEDRAMVAGALGFLPDDERLFDAFAIAGQAGIAFRFEFGELMESQHPNAVKFTLTGANGRVATLVADSTGGGMIATRLVDGYPLRINGDTYVLLVFDPAATLPATAYEGTVVGLPGFVEIGASAAEGRGRLHWARLAERPDLEMIGTAFSGYRVAVLAPILPVFDTLVRKPQLFDTMVRWREVAAERGLSLPETAIRYEMEASGWSRERVVAHMRMIEHAMHRQTHAVYEEPLDVPATSFRPDLAADWARHMDSPRRLTDGITAQTIKWAYGAGAGIPGVPTVAGPMGSGGGYVHAALWAVKEAHGCSDDDLLAGLFVAAGVGAIAYSRTEPTGEITGCSGETGVCGAMAAAGIVAMVGGTPEEAENAASLLLQAVVGVPCDPIAGGAGQPCRSRIINTTCMAHVFADLALAGREAILPLHEVIDIVDQIGRGLPAGLRCTGRGGASVAPAAQRKAVAFHDWFETTAREDTRRPPGNLI
jgi:L-serine dehydratase